MRSLLCRHARLLDSSGGRGKNFMITLENVDGKVMFPLENGVKV